MASNRFKGLAPGSWLIMIGRRVITHRMGNTTLRLQPVIALPQQLSITVFGKKGRINTAAGRFPVHRFGTIFTELDQTFLWRFPPGTAGTIQAVILIGFQHGANISYRIFTAQPVSSNAYQCAPTCSRTIVWFVMTQVFTSKAMHKNSATQHHDRLLSVLT